MNALIFGCRKTAKMKFLILNLLLLYSWNGISQETTEIEQAISRGNSTEIARHFGSEVELTILGIDQQLSKDKAHETLRDFFTHHQVIAFTVVHRGRSDTNLDYLIGQLNTRSGDYHVTVYSTISDDRIRIVRMEIVE